MSEASYLVNNFKVENVIFNCGDFNDLEKELISILKKKNIKYYIWIKELNVNDNKNEKTRQIYIIKFILTFVF